MDYDKLVKMANEVHRKTLAEPNYLTVNVSDVCPYCLLPLLSVVEDTLDKSFEKWEYKCKGCDANGTLDEIKREKSLVAEKSKT